jgi:TetR/AcrR family transcriptional repressor of nem operon
MNELLSTQAGRIVDCAQELIAVGGYNGFSYADISERVGITKASIHHYFPKKSDLVRVLVQRYRGVAAAGLATLAEQVPSPFARLNAYATWWATCIGDGSVPICICAMLAAELPALPTDVAVEVRLYFVELAAWLEAAIAAGRDDRSLASELDPAIEAQAFMATVHGAMLSARVSGDPRLFERSVRAALARMAAPR